MKLFKVLSIGLFVLLLLSVLTKHKQFVVWSQVTDHYRGEMAAHNTFEYCKIIQQQKIYTNKMLVSQRASTQNEETCNSAETLTLLKEKVEQSLLAVGEKSTIYTLLSQKSHTIRALLLYPAIAAWLNFNINPHYFFSILALVIILICSLLISKSFKSSEYFNFSFFASVFIFSSLGFLMNGRLLFLFLAVSIYIYLSKILLVKASSASNTLKYLALMFLCLTLSHISSGVNFVFLGLVISHLLYEIFKSRQPSYIKIGGLLFFTFLQAYLVSSGVIKNYLHFKKDNFADTIRGYLQHGWLSAIVENNFGLSVLLLVILIMLIVAYKCRQFLYQPLWLCLIGFMVGGLIGRSVFLGVIPVLIYLLSALYFEKNLKGALKELNV